MTAVSPPFALQAGSHPASTVRQMLQAITGSPFGSFAGGMQPTTGGGGHGVCSPTDLLTTQNGTPNMSVNVAGGMALVRGTESTHQGVHSFYNDGTVNLAVSAADPSNPRRDAAVVRIRDAAYSGASNDAALVIVTGTPAASPSDPTLPANSLVLDRIAVAAAATSITNANITRLAPRAVALGGIQPVASTTRPSGAAMSEGLVTFETDLDRLAIAKDGTNWASLLQPAFGARTAYTPTWSSDGTQPVLGNGTLTGRYRLVAEKELLLQITLQAGTTTTFGTSTYRLSLPAGMTAAAGGGLVSAIFTDASAGQTYALTGIINGGTSTIVCITQASPGATVTNLVPVTWAQVDSLTIVGIVEIA